MFKPFKTRTDEEFLEELISDKCTISHEYGERFAGDIREAVASILLDYEELKEQKEYYDEISEEMLKQIKKLEKMLDRRGVKYKKWEDVEAEWEFSKY